MYILFFDQVNDLTHYCLFDLSSRLASLAAQIIWHPNKCSVLLTAPLRLCHPGYSVLTPRQAGRPVGRSVVVVDGSVKLARRPALILLWTEGTALDSRRMFYQTFWKRRHLRNYTQMNLAQLADTFFNVVVFPNSRLQSIKKRVAIFIRSMSFVMYIT